MCPSVMCEWRGIGWEVKLITWWECSSLRVRPIFFSFLFGSENPHIRASSWPAIGQIWRIHIFNEIDNSIIWHFHFLISFGKSHHCRIISACSSCLLCLSRWNEMKCEINQAGNFEQKSKEKTFYTFFATLLPKYRWKKNHGERLQKNHT